MVQLSARFERLALDSRQLLGGGDGDGLLGGLFGGNDDEETTTSAAASGNPTRSSAAATTASQTATATSQALPASSTAALPPAASRPPTVPVSSGTTSVPAVTQSTFSSAVPSSTLIPVQEETTSVSAAPQTQETTAPAEVVTVVTQGGAPVTLTSTAPISAQTGEPAVPSPVGASSFLENKPLSGAIFGVAGLVGLIALIFLITFIVRKKRNKQLVDEAVSFDPSSFATHRSTDIERNTINNEKAYYGGSESGHGHGSAVLPPTTYQAYDYNQGYGATSPSAAYYANAATSGYNQPQQNWAYNTNPVQPPSANMAGMMGPQIPRVAPPSLRGGEEYNGPMSAGTVNGYNYGGPPGIPVTRTPSPLPAAVAPARRSNDNGSVHENPYLAAQDYKVANV